MNSDNKENKAKEFFGQTDNYLKDNQGIRIRLEVIQHFLRDKSCDDIIDIACGNGMVSIPFLTSDNKLTLLDISDNMLEIAMNNVPEKHRDQVRIINGNFSEVELQEAAYDTVICMGFLSHISNPEIHIRRIARLVKPGGNLVIQNTNSKHLYTFIVGDLYHGLQHLLGLKPYRYTKVPSKLVQGILEEEGLVQRNQYNYISSFMLLSKILSGASKYKITRFLFGNGKVTRNLWLGNDCIFHYTN